jgi:hypothetical protein
MASAKISPRRRGVRFSRLEGVRSLDAAESDGTMFRSRGCKGLQPSKVNRGYRSLERALEGAVPSAPPNPMGQCSAPAAARDRSLQVRRTIGALIEIWRAPVPRRRQTRWDNVALPRLQGTAALQVRRTIGALIEIWSAGPSAPPKPDCTRFRSRGCKGVQTFYRSQGVV